MAHSRFLVFRACLAGMLLLTTHLAADAGAAATRGAAGALNAPESSVSVHGGPLFIENAGQWPETARFQVWGGGPTLWLAEDAIWMSVVAGSQVEGSRFERVPGAHLGERNLEPATLNGVNIRLSFPGANPHPRLEPFERRDTHISYFLGRDPAGWRPDVPVWGGVRYVDLYPGVDLVVGAGVAGTDPAFAPARDAPAQDAGRPQGSPLPWRLEVRAGADLAAMRLRVEGADAVTVDGDALRLSTTAGEVSVPLLAVERPALSLPKGANVQRANVERADVSAFDVTAPFVPAHANPQSQMQNPQSRGLVYSTFLGGASGFEEGRGIFVDAQGSAYVTGDTNSSDFPTTPGALDPDFSGLSDAFVAKINSTGSRLIYATFLGGRGNERGFDIAVDDAGYAYLVGFTDHATDFPVTPGALDTSPNGGTDAFVVKLNPTGSALTYATLLGGNGLDGGSGIAVDSTGHAYVSGETQCPDFPTTWGALDKSWNGQGDAYVIKLNPAGSSLIWATFLGGAYSDGGDDIAVDAAGNAYVVGSTDSRDFPTTPDAFDRSFNGGWGDVFVAKLSSSGATLVYATYLGGSGINGDFGTGIAVDSGGHAYVTGDTDSSDFPTTPSAFDTDRGCCGDDAFVAKLNPTASSLVYSTYLGGNREDWANAIAVDAAGRAYVAGFTHSLDFPTTPGSLDSHINNMSGDAFVVKLSPNGDTLSFATLLGGSDYDDGTGIAVDRVGRAYVAGRTDSSDFPTTVDAFDSSYNKSGDVYVVNLLTAPVLQGVIWRDVDGDATRDAGEPGLAGAQVCAEPLGHRPIRCATSGPDGSYAIELDAPGTYLVGPTGAPAGMQLTTPGFRLPVVVREGEQVWDVDFGYR